MVSALAIVPVVVLVLAVALALRVDRRRMRDRSGIPHAIRDEAPRRYGVRGASLSQAIDEAFDALEIKPVTYARVPSAELSDETPSSVPTIELIDETPQLPEHSKFDFSDTPNSDALLTATVEELNDELLTARTVVARVYDVPYNAFATSEPTVTVVDDPDSADMIDELAAFLAREPAPLAASRAARGSQAPIDRARTFRGDLRTAIPQRASSYVTPVTPRHPMRARTPT